jgi:hypothetical protein
MAMSDISDHAATVISHNRLMAASKACRRARRYVLQLSAIVARFSDAQNELRCAQAKLARSSRWMSGPGKG